MSLDVQHICEVVACLDQPWLVEGLWAEQGTGLLTASPKSYKSWLALDLALSVATGTPALGTFKVPRAGPVLLFAAEDSATMVRRRLAGMAVVRGLSLADAPIHLIRAPVLRLDHEEDQAELAAVAGELRPCLLILDPLVRCHTRDENSAQEIAGLLGYLRYLQREIQMAVLVVHHARKASASRPGLMTRGSGDLWAWGDSNLYLRRRDDQVQTQVEHRNARAPEPFSFQLVDDGQPTGPYLRLLESGRACEGEVPPPAAPLGERVLGVLGGSTAPLTQTAIREALRVKTQRLVETMRSLETDGAIERAAEGWRLRGRPPGEDVLFPVVRSTG